MDMTVYLVLVGGFTLNTSEVRTWALKGAEQRLVEISEETQAIYRNFPELRRGLKADGVAVGQRPDRPRRRRQLSAAARKRISEAVKARWARQKGVASAEETAKSENVKIIGEKGARRHRGPRKMSAAARRRISEAQKARWAKVRSQKGDSTPKPQRAAKKR